jgi:hypothetical protein
LTAGRSNHGHSDFSLTALLEGIPAGAWVAISEEQNKVLAWGIDAQEVLHEAQGKGEHSPLITRVPDRHLMAMFF